MRTLHDPRVTYKLRDNAGLDNLSISVTTSVHKVLSRDPKRKNMSIFCVSRL